MVLDPTVRGYIEQSIDSAVKSVPDVAKSLFDPEEKRKVGIQNENDFTLGAAMGMLLQTAILAILAVNRSWPTQEEMKEIENIIYRRIPEFKNSMFNAG